MWQTIQTAPKIEYQEILVCSYEHVTAPDGRQVTFYNCDIVAWVSWADDGRGGWYNGDVAVEADHYTHWQPVPLPPQSIAPGQ